MNSCIISQCTAVIMALLVMMAMSWTLPTDTEARQVRNNTRRNVNRNANANYNRNRNAHVNVHRDIDVDVDHHYHGYYDNYHPVATAVGVAAAATITAAVIGSIVYSLPPSCSTVVVNGFAYQQCGSTWYQPQYAGTQVSYVVINPPR